MIILIVIAILISPDRNNPLPAESCISSRDLQASKISNRNVQSIPNTMKYDTILLKITYIYQIRLKKLYVKQTEITQ